MAIHFTYHLKPNVRVGLEALDDFLCRRRWFRHHTRGGDVVVNDVKRWESGFLRSVTITFGGSTFVLEEDD